MGLVNYFVAVTLVKRVFIIKDNFVFYYLVLIFVSMKMDIQNLEDIKVLELLPDEFVLDEIYRFEEMSDPGRGRILFAISSPMRNIKESVIHSFGADFGYRSSKWVQYLYQSKTIM